MAQGFVTNSNLSESSSFLSDKNILDNLGGVGISDDIRLFVGNLGHRSRLVNNPRELGESIPWGGFEIGKSYKINNVGNGRDWAQVGWQANTDGTGSSALFNDVFIATDSGADYIDGAFGSAFELISVNEFTSFFETSGNPSEGWTIKVKRRIGRVAFTQGTLVSINNGQSYDYIVVNSNGIDTFQLADKLDLDAIWDLDTGSGAGVVTNLTISRNDSITTENINNAHITKLGEDVSLSQRDNEDGLSRLSPDPFGEVEIDTASGETYLEGGIPEIQSEIDQINLKKKKVILTYVDNRFNLQYGVRFDGLVRVTNRPQSSTGKTLKIGVPTLFGDLVTGQKYEVTQIGNAIWSNVGTNNLALGVENISLTQSNLEQDRVYKIIDFGTSTLGTDGALIFTDGSVNGSVGNEYIQLTNGTDHGLQTNDLVVYQKTSGADITPLINDNTYYVRRLTAERIQLMTSSTNDGGSALDLTKQAPYTGEYKLIVDNQEAWNELSGTTSAPVIYEVGDLVTASNLPSANEISGAIVAPAIFVATSTGGNQNSSSRAKAIQPKGLYIANPATGEAKRAFSGKDNPWIKEQNIDLTISNTSNYGNLHTNFLYNGALLPNISGTIPNLTLSAPFLKTTAATAQAGNLLIDRRDLISWGTFVPTESYIIADLGVNRDWSEVYGLTAFEDVRISKKYEITTAGDGDWNSVAGTVGVDYSVGDIFIAIKDGFSSTDNANKVAKMIARVGDSFVATSTGAGSTASGSPTPSGGTAKGEPKLIFTNDDQDAIDDDGLYPKANDGETFERRLTEFTHKIPLNINGEEYTLLAYADDNDVAAGDYKVITMEETGP